jgi:hypothetical protein
MYRYMELVLPISAEWWARWDQGSWTDAGAGQNRGFQYSLKLRPVPELGLSETGSSSSVPM